MASKVNKKLSVEEFYARRAEVQELVDNSVVPQDIMDGAMGAVARESDHLGIVDIPFNQFQLEKKKSTSFTTTTKQWFEQTKAIGITSKQGKQEAYAHLIIAGQFAA